MQNRASASSIHQQSTDAPKTNLRVCMGRLRWFSILIFVVRAACYVPPHRLNTRHWLSGSNQQIRSVTIRTNMASEPNEIVETSKPASLEDCDATNNEEATNGQTKRVEMAGCGGCKIEKPATMAYYSKTQLVKGGYRRANRGKENMMLRRQAKETKDEEVDDNQPSDYGYKGVMMCKKCQTEKRRGI